MKCYTTSWDTIQKSDLLIGARRLVKASGAKEEMD
jgi:hypothetical protein